MSGGVRIGVDVGSVRVGVAGSDASGVLASPITVLRRDMRGESDLTDLARLVAERDASAVVVGLPRSLSGRSGRAEESARSYAQALARLVAPTPVRLVDERLSTVSATRELRASGVPGRRQRAVVDAAAAVVVLQAALDQERATGRPAGQLVEP